MEEAKNKQLEILRAKAEQRIREIKKYMFAIYSGQVGVLEQFTISMDELDKVVTGMEEIHQGSPKIIANSVEFKAPVADDSESDTQDD